MHKHFRMVNIRDYMLSQGVINLSDKHTSTAGLWRKLESLYDLTRLDEREDSVVADGMDDDGKSLSYWRDFELPRDDFEAMMWDRRLAPDGTSSPEYSRRESTVADTDEPRSSPISSRGGGRGGRASARKSGRLSRLQNELETEKSSRRTSKAESTVDEDQHMEDVDNDEEANESEEDEEGEEEETGGREEVKQKRIRQGRKQRKRKAWSSKRLKRYVCCVPSRLALRSTPVLLLRSSTLEAAKAITTLLSQLLQHHSHLSELLLKSCPCVVR